MAGRKAGKGGRKRHQKLHAMTGNGLLVIDGFLVAAGTAGDSSIGKKMVRLLAQSGGDMCLDSAWPKIPRLRCGHGRGRCAMRRPGQGRVGQAYKPHIARAYAVRAELA